MRVAGRDILAIQDTSEIVLGGSKLRKAGFGPVGRGGWTWYTGAVGWMQRAGTESILGLTVESGVLCLNLCIPKSWPGFEVVLKHGAATYKIAVLNPAGLNRGIATARIDGTEISARPLRLPLMDDGKSHTVHITLGE